MSVLEEVGTGVFKAGRDGQNKLERAFSHEMMKTLMQNAQDQEVLL